MTMDGLRFLIALCTSLLLSDEVNTWSKCEQKSVLDHAIEIVEINPLSQYLVN